MGACERYTRLRDRRGAGLPRWRRRSRLQLVRIGALRRLRAEQRRLVLRSRGLSDAAVCHILRLWCGNALFGALFDTRNYPFTKTGSGQTQENLRATAFCAGKDAWTDPEVTGLGWARRETQWDGDSNLYCVSTEDSECRGPGAGVRLMRCSWEGGHSWPSACHRGCTEIPWVRSKAVLSPPFLRLAAQKRDLILQ